MTDSSAAISSSTGVISAATAGSVTLPVAGDHTMRTAASPDPLGGRVDSISVAVVDSVSGNEKESLNSPPSWVPMPITPAMAMNHAMSARTGLRTAHRERAPMIVSLA